MISALVKGDQIINYVNFDTRRQTKAKARRRLIRIQAHRQTQAEAIQTNTNANVNVFVRLTCRFNVSITHTAACSAQLQSTLASVVWRHDGRALQHAAYACSTSNNKHKRVALSWPCSEWLHKAQYAKVIVHCYICSYSPHSCCCCCWYNVNLARESSAASVCGHFVVGIFRNVHVFYIIFAFVYVTAPIHSHFRYA